MKLWQKVVIGFLAGLFLGLVLPVLGGMAPAISSVAQAGGKAFIHAIKMLIVPLVFSSLVVGITSMNDIKKMGRIGLKTFAIYLLTTSLAISIGLGVSAILKPGLGLSIELGNTPPAKTAPAVPDTLIHIIPSNPIAAMASGNILQIIVFALLLGVAINLAGDSGKPLKSLFESLAEVMYKLTHLVMEVAPYGVFCLMLWVAGDYGPAVLLPLIKVVLALYLACALHMFGVIGSIITFVARLNPIRFFIGLIDAHLVAFTTTSSSGTLPVTMECVEDNLGVSNSVASFVLPLGATINMDGTAIYQGICALFIAQAAGIELSMAQYATIIMTSTLASIGTAGVPGAGLIMLSLVLSSVGLPIEGVALVAGIDRVLDMARTMVNVTGDAMAAVLVGRSEGEFSLDIYNKKAIV